MRYVIIGGGITGTTAAEEIRKQDDLAEITIIEGEHHRLYSRVLLPHYIEGKIPREKVFLKKEEWYVEKRIELMLGVRVTEIDVNNSFVRTTEDRELPFDKLLIATGGDLRLHDEDIRGVVYLRGLDDADQIVQIVKEIKMLPEEARQAVIFGGGFIALEFINIFKKFDIQTTLVMRSGGFWSRVLSQETQSLMKKHVEKNGVRVITDQTIMKLHGEKELEGVELSNGEVIEAKVLGIGIGITAEKTLFDSAKIECKTGVVANEYLETTHENVYTAGDVAEFLNVTTGRVEVVGNWMNAVMQARAVGKTMTGERTQFELVSSYSTDFLEKFVVFIGDTHREHADQVEQFRLDDENAIELFHQNGATVGAILIGDISKRQDITNAIKAKEKYVG